VERKVVERGCCVTRNQISNEEKEGSRSGNEGGFIRRISIGV
jgi:hypothetical protein